MEEEEGSAPTKYYKAVRAVPFFEADGGVGVKYLSCCGQTRWVVGETNTLPPLPKYGNKPKLCEYGFHACLHPAAPFLNEVLYYGYSRTYGDVLMEVQLHGDISTDGIKSVALGCTPLRIIPEDEYCELVKGQASLESSEVKLHLVNGVLHSPDVNTPALVNMAYNTTAWYKHGKIHRDGDKPAFVRVDSAGKPIVKAWYAEGVHHRECGKPAYLGELGCSWYVGGHADRSSMLHEVFKTELESSDWLA